MKIYEISLDSEVFAISLVDEPAIESNFVALNKQKQQIQLNEEKHLVYGAVLIPNKLIYRYDDTNGEYYIRFSKDVIEKMAHEYLSMNRLNNFTLQHTEETSKITLVESWLKTSENDKSVNLGLDVPIGSWICGAKINDDELWQKIKHTNEFNGFSVESMCGLEEVEKLSKQHSMELIEKIEKIINVALEKINAVEEPIVEEPKEEEVDYKAENEALKARVAELEADKAELEAEKLQMEAEVEMLRAKVAEMENNEASIQEKDAKIEEMIKEIEKLSKQPMVNPIEVEKKTLKSNSIENVFEILKQI